MSVLYREESNRLSRTLSNLLKNSQQRDELRNVLIGIYNEVICYETSMYGDVNDLTLDDLRIRLISVEEQLFNKYKINNENIVSELFPTTLDISFYLKALGDALKEIGDIH